MRMETLKDLFNEQLMDIYDAEHQIVETLPVMMQAASSDNLKRAFQLHLDETRQHISRLEQVFQFMGARPERKTCKAMRGLVAEGQELMQEDADKDVMDAGLIAAAQRVEHYEMAGYGTLMAYARQIGEEQAIRLLSQTLEEEKATDAKLSQLAESSINVKAAN